MQRNNYPIQQNINNVNDNSSNIENGLSKLIKSQSKPASCKYCNSRKLEYDGLGKYKCIECKKYVYSNYGLVRETLDIYGSLDITSLMTKTGLSRKEIKELIDNGSISVSATGIRLNL